MAPDINVTLTCPATLPAISGDATMLREALANLLDNAVSHGGPTLNQITIAASATAHEVVLSLEDNGKGIPESDIPRALERFSRLSETSSSGLGLSIVQAIIAVHGGRFQLSDAAPGLCAVIGLPATGPG